MVTRRPPRMLPGSDPLVIHKIFIPIYLCMAVVSLGLAMALAALDAREGQSWHLPWPIVQWALTTPLGILAMTLVGGLVGGLSSVVAAAAILGGQFAYAVDVTELPPMAWPAASPWRRPGGARRGGDRLGRRRCAR